MKHELGIVLGILLSMCLPSVQGARILLVPWPFGSHIHQLVTIGEALIARGHEVYATASPAFEDLPKFKKRKLEFIFYNVADPEWYQIETMESMEDYIGETPLMADLRTDVPGMTEICTNPLTDQQFFQKLKSLKFDFAVVDAFPCYRCMLVLMHRLGVPYASMETVHEPWLLRNPALPSALPTNMGNQPLTERMNFWERLDNLWSVIDWAAFTGVSYLEDDFLKDYFYEREPVPLNQLAGNSALWLIDHTPLLDYPRPQMSNEIHIGGITTKPGKPLPAELEVFMSSIPEGVILVSFGSSPANLPKFVVDEFFTAFKQVKYNVVMRFPLEIPDDVPEHIKLLHWMPQNDLLGHWNTKLFITHCGAGGQNEALYHGVPMIGLPMFGDQPYNAKRIVYHGYGQSLKLKEIKSGELVHAINEVISNESYAANIGRASATFRDQPMAPLERAVFWIEHVIKYGGSHMHSHALDMAWYEYLMLDLLALVLGVILVACIFLFFIVKNILNSVAPSNKFKVD